MTNLQNQFNFINSVEQNTKIVLFSYLKLQINISDTNAYFRYIFHFAYIKAYFRQSNACLVIFYGSESTAPLTADIFLFPNESRRANCYHDRGFRTEDPVLDPTVRHVPRSDYPAITAVVNGEKRLLVNTRKTVWIPAKTGGTRGQLPARTAFYPRILSTEFVYWTL